MPREVIGAAVPTSTGAYRAAVEWIGACYAPGVTVDSAPSRQERTLEPSPACPDRGRRGAIDR